MVEGGGKLLVKSAIDSTRKFSLSLKKRKCATRGGDPYTRARSKKRKKTQTFPLVRREISKKNRAKWEKKEGSK